MGDRFGRGAYSDEALWRARYDAAMAEVTFWRNLALLRPFAVSTRTVTSRRRRPARRPPVEPVPVPRQRTRHPAVAELAEWALRNSNRGGRA